MKLDTVVIPAAGLGTRFLPATKSVPKELLPVVDKPLVAYAVEEACQAGITNFVFVTSRSKKALEDYFDDAPDIARELELAGKSALLEVLKQTLPANATFGFIRQRNPQGLGHAVFQAYPLVKDNPFAVILPDELMLTDPGRPGALSQLANVFRESDKDVLGVLRVPLEQTHAYGIVEPRDSAAAGAFEIKGMVEKPKSNPPSQYAAVGRYVFGADFWQRLGRLKKGAQGEYQLTDAIVEKIQDEGGVLALPLEAHRFDCGSKLGYLQANAFAGARYSEQRDEFVDYLRSLVTTLTPT